MLAIKSNVARHNYVVLLCRWLKPTAIKSNVPFKLLRSVRPEIINSDFIVGAFSIAVGFNQRQQRQLNQMFWFKLQLNQSLKLKFSFIVRAFSIAVG
ncbi:MAG: hypothetical protein IPH77_13485 [Ignavibacteria bacterium]|nr:hypothetical protein [Ignavibacteria bacterium]